MSKCTIAFAVSTVSSPESVDTRVFVEKDKAMDFYGEQTEKYFGDKFRENRKLFPPEASVDDYQLSDVWWDNGDTVFLSFNKVEVE